MRYVGVAGAFATFAAILFEGLMTGRGDPRLGYWVLAPAIGFLALRFLTTTDSDESDGRLRPLIRRRGWEPDPGLPASLRRAERLVHHGPRDTHTAAHRLLPTLRELAVERLNDFRGVDLEHPEARALLGDPAWCLLDPGWSSARHPGAPGPSLAELESTVAAIERISR